MINQQQAVLFSTAADRDRCMFFRVLGTLCSQK